MNGHRIPIGSHLDKAGYWRKSLQTADVLMQGVMGDTRQLRNIKQVSLCLWAKNLIEHDRGGANE